MIKYWLFERPFLKQWRKHGAAGTPTPRNATERRCHTAWRGRPPAAGEPRQAPPTRGAASPRGLAPPTVTAQGGPGSDVPGHWGVGGGDPTARRGARSQPRRRPPRTPPSFSSKDAGRLCYAPSTSRVSEAQEDEVCNWTAKVTLRDRVLAGVCPLHGFSPWRATDGQAWPGPRQSPGTSPPRPVPCPRSRPGPRVLHGGLSHGRQATGASVSAQMSKAISQGPLASETQAPSGAAAPHTSSQHRGGQGGGAGAVPRGGRVLGHPRPSSSSRPVMQICCRLVTCHKDQMSTAKTLLRWHPETSSPQRLLALWKTVPMTTTQL